MKKTILIITIILVLPLLSANQVFYTNLDLHKNNTANISNIQIIDGEESNYYGDSGDYKFYIKNTEDEIIWEQDRKIKWFIMTNPPTPTETISVSIKIPYNYSASKIGIEKNREKIIESNISKRICVNNDGKCSSYCDGRGIDSDCSESEDLETPETPDTSEDEGNRTETQTQEVVDSDYSNYILIGIVVAALILGLFIISGKIKIEG